MNLEKEFVSYEQALALKELGFDERCFYQYVRDFINDGELIPIVSFNNYPIFRNNTQVSDYSGGDCFTAPTFSQAFRWFRDKYNLFGQVLSIGERNYEWRIQNIKYLKHKRYFTLADIGYGTKDNSYEESELECLNKLIEIVKNK